MTSTPHNKEEHPNLQVDLSAVTLNGPCLDSPSSELVLTSTSTTSVASLAFSEFTDDAPPQTPKDQPIMKMTKEEREEKARAWMLVKGLSITYDDLKEEGKARARLLMSPDYEWSPNKQNTKNNCKPTTFRREWDAFCEKLNSKRSWKNFEDVFFYEAALGNYLVIRCQKASICYMHAVSVFQHYIQYKRQGLQGESHEMLDLSEYIRKQFDNKKLEKYLIDGGGGSAYKFFCDVTGNVPLSLAIEKIFITPKSVNEISFKNSLNLIYDAFHRSKEPALVTEFLIQKDFLKCKTSYEDEFDCQLEDNKPVGLHSMVLIGVTRDSNDGKMWFLLQNFWAKQYLVEVSGEYLACCRPTIIFLGRDAKFELDLELSVVDAYYTETEEGPEEETYQAGEED